MFGVQRLMSMEAVSLRAACVALLVSVPIQFVLVFW